jgi:uncharacterized membrane protein YeiH
MMDNPLSSVLPALALLNYVGIAVFAISGALLAAEKRLTLVTFIFFAVVAGIGGGTIRDLLIGAPVFWRHENGYVLICLAGALLVWVTPLRLWGGRALVWFDAAGLAVYSSYGAAKAMAFEVAPLPAFVMGVVTACAGGIIRDVLADQPSILLRPELYVTAAALSAGLMIVLGLFGVPAMIAGVVATLAGFVLRALAIRNGWSIPAYRR